MGKNVEIINIRLVLAATVKIVLLILIQRKDKQCVRHAPPVKNGDPMNLMDFAILVIQININQERREHVKIAQPIVTQHQAWEVARLVLSEHSGELQIPMHTHVKNVRKIHI